MLRPMDIRCPNYEISIPSDGTERMISFSAQDVLAHGVAGGDPLALTVFRNGARVELQDGTRVVFPDLPADLHGQLTRHPSAWICALVGQGQSIGVQWGGQVAITLVDETLPQAR